MPHPRAPTEFVEGTKNLSIEAGILSTNWDRVKRAALTHPVKLLFFTQTIGAPEAVAVAKQILDEIVSLSHRVSHDGVNLILPRD